MATKNETSSEDDLRQQVAALRADVEKLTQTLVRTGEERASVLLDDARKVKDSALDGVAHGLESGREFSEQQVEGAQEWVRRNPLTAVACAAGVGFLLAHLRARD